MSRKLLALTIILTLIVTAGLAGCGKKATEEKKVEQVIRYNLGTEPETMDSAKATGQPEFNVLNAQFEGLVRLDSKFQVQPGMAEKWDISPDQLTYTFHLRDAKWSNGDPVTADDFAYAWFRVLDPKTAADYAYQLYYIEGAQAYNSVALTDDKGNPLPDAEAKLAEAKKNVKITVKDPKTLEVKLTSPTPYFLSLMAFPTYFPVHKKTVESNPEWATKPETIISNGPFKLTQWEHQGKLVFEKNANYWDAKTVKLDKMIWTMVQESSTELVMFESGDLDIADNPPSEEMDRLKNEGKVTILPDLAVYYYIFNTEKKPFDDVRVRKALALAIDRAAIVKSVTKSGQIPATAFVPLGLPDVKAGDDFRKVGGDYFKDADIETAKKLLAEAGYPDGKGFPAFEILYNTSEGHKKIAEAVQEMWKKNLGLTNITLTNQEWGVYLETRDQGNFQVARAGWGADYLDAMTFLDLFELKDGGNNNTRWSDPEYARLIQVAKTNADPAVRIKAMHDAEKILMDNMPIIPFYFYTNPIMIKPKVKDLAVYTFGPTLDFKWAYVTE